MSPVNNSNLGPKDLDLEKATKSGIWKKGNIRIFTSHKDSHRKTAGEIKSTLETYFISCFVAHADIRPTEAWKEKILLALKTMQGMLVLLSPDFHESDYTDQEVGFSLGKNVPIITIMNGCRPYGFMADHQGLDSQGLQNDALCQKIVATLLLNDKVAHDMSSHLVKRLEGSKSYNQTADTLILMRGENFRAAQPFSDRLKKVLEENKQVSGYYYAEQWCKEVIARCDASGIPF